MGTIGLFLDPHQIQTLKSGHNLTSCEPKLRVDNIDSTFISKRSKSIGKIFDVADENGSVKTQAKLVDAFITSFGAPDLKMVAGLGFGADIEKFKTEYSAFWKDNFPEAELADSTELFVSIWEPIQ